MLLSGKRNRQHLLTLRSHVHFLSRVLTFYCTISQLKQKTIPVWMVWHNLRPLLRNQPSPDTIFWWNVWQRLFYNQLSAKGSDCMRAPGCSQCLQWFLGHEHPGWSKSCKSAQQCDKRYLKGVDSLSPARICCSNYLGVCCLSIHWRDCRNYGFDVHTLELPGLWLESGRNSASREWKAFLWARLHPTFLVR